MINNPQTKQVKYIFLDIIGYSNNRSVEAQVKIIGILNEVVSQSLKSCKLKKKDFILLPTGDGLCICIINSNLQYDVHIIIALDILKSLQEYNNAISKEMEKFEIRIGINQNLDNLVIDINGKKNVAGSGINIAQRIMDKSDKSAVLLGTQVYNELQVRGKYIGKFKKYSAATIKHGETIDIYQLILEGYDYLNCDVPKSFIPQQVIMQKVKEIEQTDSVLQIYMCLITIFSELIKKEIDDVFDHYYCRTLFYKIAICMNSYFHRQEFNYDFTTDFNGIIDYSSKIIDFSSGIKYCKENIGHDFHLDVAYYIESLISNNSSNDHFFEANTNKLKINGKYLDKIKDNQYFNKLTEYKNKQ